MLKGKKADSGIEFQIGTALAVQCTARLCKNIFYSIRM